MAEIYIMEGLIQTAKLRVVKEKYKKEALQEGPQVFFRHILDHEPADPLTRWDCITLSYLSCSLINDLVLEFCKEGTDPSLLSSDDNLLSLLTDMVDYGRLWCQECEELQKRIGAIHDDTNEYPSYEILKDQTLRSCEITERTLVQPLRKLMDYIETSGLSHYFGCWPYIDKQLNYFRTYYALVKSGELEQPLVIPPLKDERIIYGVDHYWMKQVQKPMSHSYVDIVLAAVLSSNIVNDIVTEMTKDITALLEADEPCATKDIIDSFSELLEKEEECRKLYDILRIQPADPRDRDKLKQLMTAYKEKTIPLLYKISGMIDERKINQFFPPNPYVGARINDFMKYYTLLMST